MPRISTDNYDTVASWNGSQDLFIVEQPDGTKVATPAMVKQFIEAGNFTATGEITDGHGNKLADMAKSADVNDLISQLNDEIDAKAETLIVNSTSFDIASRLPVGESAAVIVSDSSLCTAFASDTNSLTGVVSRLTDTVFAWNLVTFNYKFVYVRTDASYTVSRRFYAAGTSF